MSNAVEIRELHYRAGKSFAIEDLDLSVPTGSIYGFLGPNGSGKTTTIRLILGLLRPRSGTIRVLGEPMPLRAPAVLGRVGFVPEQPHLDPTLTVCETLRFREAFYPTWDGDWAGRLLQTFDLDPHHPFGKLSKGQKGKVMMLLALAQRPDLLVLDEPTDGLDPVVRRDMLAALIDYVSQHGATVFISSHLVHELERMCDWIGVMDNGRLVSELPMERFKNGIKRLLVSAAPAETESAPFSVLARDRNGAATETWLVRGWEPGMSTWFDARDASLQSVIDLDLEDGFVELLRTFRTPHGKEVR
ncbi:MAG TPA: ABC transporter ATP-binding protein [Gemmatimonadales bacterium]|jgi:ABC-2 type transport system ATP-binding protein|nr:ABC transporter ATP-binding protein [Gemmatimonadales bacterium]